MTKLSDDAKGYVKETTLAQYSALQAEIVQRLGSQSTVLGWLIGLTGAVVGVLTTVEIPGLTKPLAVAALSGTDTNALIAVAVLAAAFTLGVELLISLTFRSILDALPANFQRGRLASWVGAFGEAEEAGDLSL